MLSRFEPDNLYCVLCHAPAAGPCATCRAIICADCAVMTGGSVQLAAVCKPCHRAGRGRVGWAAWWPIVRMLLVLGVVLVLVALLLG